MSHESSTALHQLEAEVLRAARQELEPDQPRIENLWQSVAAASALGTALIGTSASVSPASGTGWMAPNSGSGLGG